MGEIIGIEGGEIVRPRYPIATNLENVGLFGNSLGFTLRTLISGSFEDYCIHIQ